MLFNSYPFLFGFLPLTLLLFYWLRRNGRLDLSVPFLMLASLAFYSYWKPADTLILLATILWNFSISRYLTRLSMPRARWMLAVGVTGDLGLLFYYKYFVFVASSIAATIGVSYSPLHIVMPIGISFFTFTQIAYLVDCFRSRECELKFTNYGLFVTIFPHLIAGPIIHHAQMRPQFERLRRAEIDPNWVAMGILIFIVGLAKKVLLADNLATISDPIFAAAEGGSLLPGSTAWIGIAAYTLQIYFDFSGYSDMAVGLALLFGIRLPINFDSPYKSRSIIEFWRRWHITLSTWLRDYLYISLGGNRGGEFMRLRNVAITMLLGGIWHGAGWTFVIWGALHAFYIVVNHLLRKFTTPAKRPTLLWEQGSRLMTLLLVMIAWVFFRAHTVSAAMSMLRSMALMGTGFDAARALDPYDYFWLMLGAGIALFASNTQQIFRYSSAPDIPLRAPQFAPGNALAGVNAVTALTYGVLLAAVLGSIWRPAIFIYFNF